MPNIKSAKKRVKTNKRDTLRNKHYKSMLKTEIKKVENAIKAGEKDKVESLLKKALKAIGRVASKGIIHKNNAARKESRLVKKVNQFLASGTSKESEPEIPQSPEPSPAE